jgi:hypothetical protein
MLIAFLFVPNILSEFNCGWLKCFLVSATLKLKTLGILNFGGGRCKEDINCAPFPGSKLGCFGVKAGVKIGLGVLASLDDDE